MRVRFFWVILAGFAQLSCSLTSEVTFEAKVSDLHLASNSFAKQKGPDDTVTLTLPGKMLQPPVLVNPVRRSAADGSTPEAAIASVLSADRAGDGAWMIENLAPAERDAAGKELANPAAIQQTRDYYRNIGQVKIRGWADVRENRVFFLLGEEPDGDVNSLTLVVTKTPSGWKQTNALAHDDTFDVISAAVRSGGVK